MRLAGSLAASYKHRQCCSRCLILLNLGDYCAAIHPETIFPECARTRRARATFQAQIWRSSMRSSELQLCFSLDRPASIQQSRRILQAGQFASGHSIMATMLKPLRHTKCVTLRALRFSSATSEPAPPILSKIRDDLKTAMRSRDKPRSIAKPHNLPKENGDAYQRC
jgi:hypothetical protein